MKRITNVLSEYNSAKLKMEIRKDKEDEVLCGYLTILVGSEKNGITFVTEILLMRNAYDTEDNRELFHDKVEKMLKSPYKIIQTIIQKALHPLHSSNSEIDVTYAVEMLDISPVPKTEWKLDSQYLFKFGETSDSNNEYWADFMKKYGGNA